MTVCLPLDTWFSQDTGVYMYYQYLSKLITQFGNRVLFLTVSNSQRKSICKLANNENIMVICLNKEYVKLLNHYCLFFRPGQGNIPNQIACSIAIKNWLLNNHKVFNIDIIETTEGGIAPFLIDPELPPVVVMGHGSFSQFIKYNNFVSSAQTEIIQKLENLSYKYCNALTTHSHQNCHNLSLIAHREVLFARAPFILEEMETTPPNVHSDNNIILASLQLIKGALIMAETCKLMAKKKKNIKVKWIGSDTYTAPGGMKVSEYLRKFYSFIWDKNFIWTNQIDNKSALSELAAAKCAIIPSLYETFSYFALEATTLGVPLIMTEQTGISYLFKHSNRVKIVPAGNAEKLAEAIDNLDQWKNSESDDTKQIIKNYFSGDIIVEEKMQVYHTAIKNHNINYSKLNEELKFLNSYLTAKRKYYYKIRKIFKSIIKPNSKKHQ